MSLEHWAWLGIASQPGNKIVDDEIFSAIYYHTTGKAEMSVFEAIIYLADYIEDGRDFDDCVLLRDFFWDARPEKMNESERLAHLWRTMVKSVDFTVRQLTVKAHI